MLNEFHQADQLQYLPDLLVNIYDLHSPVLTPQLLKKKQKASNPHRGNIIYILEIQGQNIAHGTKHLP